MIETDDERELRISVQAVRDDDDDDEEEEEDDISFGDTVLISQTEGQEAMFCFFI